MDGTFTILSLAGLGLSVESAFAKQWHFPMSSVQNIAGSWYTLLGFGKYGGEVIVGLAKGGKLGKSNFSTESLAHQMTETKVFQALGSAYYAFEALSGGFANL